jgi:plastocyanin
MKAIVSLATVMLLLAGVGLVACGDDDDDTAATEATTTEEAAGGGGGDNQVDLSTPSGELVFKPDTATAEAGDLTIVWANEGDTDHNICMEDEQGKPVFNQVVFNGGRERSAESTPPCSKTIRGRALRARAKVKPGEYTYWCSVDKHREAGMTGTLTVE